MQTSTLPTGFTDFLIPRAFRKSSNFYTLPSETNNLSENARENDGHGTHRLAFKL